MPVCMYRLVFEDPEIKKLASSSLEIGAYTTDTIKIAGSCMFYLVHPDTKKLMNVTFFVAVNDGSMLSSCKTILMLGLIQPRTRLDYLPSRASLITSSADHPKKTTVYIVVYRSKKCSLKDLYMKWLLKCQDRSMQFPSWLQAKNRFCMNTLMHLKGLVTFQVLLIIYRLFQLLTPKQTPCCPIPVYLKEALNKT